MTSVCKPDPVFFIPGPGEVLSSIRLRYAAGGLAVAGLVSFVVVHAVIVVLAVVAFAAIMGWVIAAMCQSARRQARARAATLATVTVRQGQGVRAVTTGQRAIGAPRVVLPGQVLEAAEGERVER